jgi:repressor LexA
MFFCSTLCLINRTGSEIMNDLGKLLRKLRGDKSLREASRLSGLSYSYIASLEKGEHPKTKATIQISPESLKQLSIAYNYPYKELMKEAGYIEADKAEVVTDEQTFNLPKDAIPYIPENMIRTPLIGTIRAGQAIDRIEDIEGYVLVESELLRGREGFAMWVTGDSMNGDRIFEGDIVIVIKGEEVSPSDIAVVAVDAESATLKRVKCQEEICVLTASNPNYEAMIVPLKNVHILGKVVQVRRNV